MDQLTVIREACARLRRLPEPQWGQPPRLPLGARSPHVAPESGGDTVEQQVRAWIVALLNADAATRGVANFTPAVHALALPDVLEAASKSLAQQHPDAAELRDVADAISSARL